MQGQETPCGAAACGPCKIGSERRGEESSVGKGELASKTRTTAWLSPSHGDGGPQRNDGAHPNHRPLGFFLSFSRALQAMRTSAFDQALLVGSSEFRCPNWSTPPPLVAALPHSSMVGFRLFTTSWLLGHCTSLYSVWSLDFTGCSL